MTTIKFPQYFRKNVSHIFVQVVICSVLMPHTLVTPTNVTARDMGEVKQTWLPHHCNTLCALVNTECNIFLNQPLYTTRSVLNQTKTSKFQTSHPVSHYIHYILCHLCWVMVTHCIGSQLDIHKVFLEGDPWWMRTKAYIEGHTENVSI